LISGLVPEAVVDGLEVVEVEEHDSDGRRVPIGPGGGVLDAVGEQRPIGQTG
jgi:hypothetical protein